MKTVLVVEDEPILREVIRDVLRDEGYGVITAVDGQAMLELLERERPDLILLDVMMPVLNGQEAYSAMRSREDIPSIPVVAMSAAVGPSRLDPTISGYIPKPFDLDQLIAVVRRLIGGADTPS